MGTRAQESRGGIGGLLGRHRVAALAVGVILVGLVAFVLVWFQPQKLFLNQTVEESAPAAQEASSVIGRGQFASLAHDTTGAAVLFVVGRRQLRQVNPMPERTVETVKENLQWTPTQTS